MKKGVGVGERDREKTDRDKDRRKKEKKQRKDITKQNILGTMSSEELLRLDEVRGSHTHTHHILQSIILIMNISPRKSKAIN